MAPRCGQKIKKKRDANNFHALVRITLVCIPQEGLEPPTYGLAYHYSFHYQHIYVVCGLDYIFAISGGVRIVSTEQGDNHQQSLRLLSDYSLGSLPEL